MRKKYSVAQGVLDECGSGDIDYIKTFNTLDEAKRYFNCVKNDTNGWVFRGKKYKLVTELWKCTANEDTCIDGYECFQNEKKM